MRRIATHKTDFQTIEVWGDADEVEFRVAGATHAWWHRQRYLTGLAWDNILAASLLRPAGPPQSLLMLGLGGGTSIRSLRFLIPKLEVIAVELDKGMIKLAEDYMDLASLKIRVIQADAYEVLAQSRRQFDVVVDDVYASGPADVKRPTVYTPELSNALRRCLAPASLFVANLVTGAGHRVMQGSFRRFFKDTFPIVRSISTPMSMNEALVGGQDVLAPSCLQPYQYLWPQRQDQRYWKELRCRRL
jgi:predicted membrane-bound spermidine synthase